MARLVMITYFPIPPSAAGLCGIGYVLTAGPDGAAFRLSVLQPQAHLIVHGSLDHAFGGSGLRRNAPLTIVGRGTGASRVVIAPGTRLVGLSLLPAGWIRATGLPADLATDRLLDAAELWPASHIASCLQRVQDASDDAEAVATLAHFFEQQGARRGEADARLRAVDRWLGQTSHATVDDLARTLELSARQTERLVRRHYGFSPKLLEQQYRVLGLSAAMALGTLAFPSHYEDETIAAFYDQSHLIRNFSRFVGFTPGQFRREQATIERSLIIGRWRAGGRTPLTLWS